MRRHITKIRRSPEGWLALTFVNDGGRWVPVRAAIGDEAFVARAVKLAPEVAAKYRPRIREAETG